MINDVTVAIVNWNYGRYLPYAIASVWAQTRMPEDWYIVDDGSDEERSKRILDDLPDRVDHHPVNMGTAAAFNRAISLCSTNFLVLLDADDELDPTYLEKVMHIAEKRKARWVYTDMCKVDQYGQYITVQRAMPFNRGRLMHSHNFIHSAALIEADLLRQAGGWYKQESKNKQDDWETWKHVAALGVMPEYIPQPLLRYRIHGESRSKTGRGKP